MFGERRKPRSELKFTCLRLDWAVDNPSPNNYRTNPCLLPALEEAFFSSEVGRELQWM
jgi:hypothetical protein